LLCYSERLFSAILNSFLLFCTVPFKNKGFMHGFLTNQDAVILHGNDKLF